MAIDLKALTQDIVIMDENTKKVIVVEWNNAPKFLTYDDIMKLLSFQESDHGRSSRSDENDGPSPAPKPRDPRSLARIGILCGEIRRAFAANRVINKDFCFQLSKKMSEFDGKIHRRISSQTGHMLQEFLKNWEFDTPGLREEIEEFLKKYPMLLAVPRTIDL